jgi:hypothetical protein
VLEDFVGLALPYLVGMLVAASVFMVYLELSPPSVWATQSRPEVMLGNQTGRIEGIKDPNSGTPFASTLTILLPLVVVLFVKRVGAAVPERP